MFFFSKGQAVIEQKRDHNKELLHLVIMFLVGYEANKITIKLPGFLFTKSYKWQKHFNA